MVGVEKCSLRHSGTKPISNATSRNFVIDFNLAHAQLLFLYVFAGNDSAFRIFHMCFGFPLSPFFLHIHLMNYTSSSSLPFPSIEIPVRGNG